MSEKYAYTIKDKKQDCVDAFMKAQTYHRELADIYRYFLPFRQSTNERAPGVQGSKQEGQARADVLFDGTGISAAATFAANLQADWMPSFEDFFKLETGPLWNGDDKDRRNEDLQLVTKIVHGVLPPVRLNALEMFADLFAGTGAMFLSEGKKKGLPIMGTTVPLVELALEDGADGQVERWFWKRNYKARHLPQLWPDGKYSDRVNRLIKEKPGDAIEVVQYTYYNANEDRYDLCVWTGVDNDTVLKEMDFRVSPWVTARFFKVPGEAFGRGLAHMGLPFNKTINKTRELQLRAAAFALLGIWTRRNDGIFNPDTAAMVPGAMWKVGYNGGALGKSIERLDIPHNFDVSAIVIKDERDQLRRVLLDDELPEMADRVRSPTEIAGRMRRHDRNRGGATVRLAYEMVTPLVQRSVDILEKKRLLPGQLDIDQVLTQATVTSPAALAQRSGKMERVVSWMQIVIGLFGPQAALLAAKVEELIPELARMAGVEERYLRRKTEVAELKMMIAKMVAEAQAKAAPPPQEQPSDGAVPTVPAEQQYLNGGF